METLVKLLPRTTVRTTTMLDLGGIILCEERVHTFNTFLGKRYNETYHVSLYV